MSLLKLTKKGEYDFPVIFMVLLFVVFGIIMVFSASYYSTMNVGEGDPFFYLKRQCFFAGAGMVAMLIFMRIDYHWYTNIRVATVGLGVCFLLLILVFTPLGVNVNNAARWIDVMGFRITPSEFAKLGLIIFTASFLSDKPERIRNFTTGLVPLFGIMAVYAAIIIKQPNLSTAVVICALMVAIMFIAGLNWGYLIGVMGIFVAGMMYILNFKQDTHWYDRLTNFTNPFENKLGEGYQVSQSLIALGNGGVKGRGLGDSITKYLYLPEPQNDFILAIIGEELGFVGIAIMMICYLILIYRGFLIAVKAKDKAGMLLASGITMMLAFQVIINVAVVTASMPATGITLPFISYGGTSLIVFLISMGMLLNISRKDSKKV